MNNMMNTVDLDASNYDKKGLERIFGVADTFYDETFLDMKENELKDKIMRNNDLENEIKNKTIMFLSQAKNILLSFVKKVNINNFEQNIDALTNSILPNFQMKGTTSTTGNGSGSHYVQERKGHFYTESYPSEFYPGVINPLRKKTSRIYLNIDTKFRDNYYSSSSTNFQFDLPMKLTSILNMQLTSFEIPCTFYTFSKQAGNNFFSIRIPSTAESTVIIIPDGNYDKNTLVTYLNDTLIGLGGHLSKLIFYSNDTGTSGSGQMIVGVDSPHAPFPFILDFQADIYGSPDFNVPLPLKMGWIMGFRNGIYVNNSSYVSEGLIDVSGPKYMFLVVDDYNNNVNNNFYSAFSSSILNKNILARIALQKGNANFSVFSENNLLLVTTPRNYFGPVDIQKLKIQLLDEYGRVIQLNNMDYSFCLTFQTVYDI